MSLSYHNKYLKYKKKYLDLKSQLGSGSADAQIQALLKGLSPDKQQEALVLLANLSKKQDENDQFGLEPGSGSNQSICKDVTYISKKTEMISEGEFRFQAQKCISSNGVESIIFEPNLLEFEDDWMQQAANYISLNVTPMSSDSYCYLGIISKQQRLNNLNEVNNNNITFNQTMVDTINIERIVLVNYMNNRTTIVNNHSNMDFKDNMVMVEGLINPGERSKIRFQVNSYMGGIISNIEYMIDESTFDVVMPSIEELPYVGRDDLSENLYAIIYKDCEISDVEIRGYKYQEARVKPSKSAQHTH